MFKSKSESWFKVRQQHVNICRQEKYPRGNIILRWSLLVFTHFLRSSNWFYEFIMHLKIHMLVVQLLQAVYNLHLLIQSCPTFLFCCLKVSDPRCLTSNIIMLFTGFICDLDFLLYLSLHVDSITAVYYSLSHVMFHCCSLCICRPDQKRFFFPGSLDKTED